MFRRLQLEGENVGVCNFFCLSRGGGKKKEDGRNLAGEGKLKVGGVGEGKELVP